MGGAGLNSTEFWPALFNNLMAAKFKLIRGYPGTPQIHLAIKNGELDGVCQSWASFEQLGREALRNGEVRPLVQVSLIAISLNSGSWGFNRCQIQRAIFSLVGLSNP